MMKRISKQTICLIAAAVLLTGTLAVKSAYAYFTTYCSAQGSVKFEMGYTETIPLEKIDGKTKVVSVKNVGDYECYVRVKAFSGEGNLEYSNKSGKWTAGADGYYYYSDILAPEQTTETITIDVSGVIANVDKDHDMNVIVVQECTPVQYEEDGTPYADWTVIFTDKAE